MAVPVAEARHFEGISFRADGWAKRENHALAERIASIRSRANALSAQDGSHEIPADLVERMVENHGRLTLAYWTAMSRCMSPMITGPARFPVERNRKRTDAADKRSAEVSADLEKALRGLERVAWPHGLPGDAIRGDDPEAIDKLRAKLAEGLSYAERKRVEGRITALEARQARGRIEREMRFFRLIEDPELDRIQLVFGGRPDDATRSILKSRGFRWAPSQGAWQRHLNSNGRNAARFVESDLAKAEGLS